MQSSRLRKWQFLVTSRQIKLKELLNLVFVFLVILIYWKSKSVIQLVQILSSEQNQELFNSSENHTERSNMIEAQSRNTFQDIMGPERVLNHRIPKNLSSSHPVPFLHRLLQKGQIIDIPNEQQLAKIIQQRNTGTLTTGYSKNIFVEVLWTKNDSIARVCMFHNACIGRDGFIYLPKSFEKDVNLFRRCAGDRVKFFSNSSFSFTLANAQLNGIIEARKHIPLFLTDIMPLLYAKNLLRLKAQNYSKDQLFYRCLHGSQDSCLLVRPTPRTELDVLHVQDDVLNPDKNDWVHKLSEMLLPRRILMSTRSMFNPFRTEKICYISILSYSPFNLGIVPNNTNIWRNSQERFFMNNGLESAPRILKSELKRERHQKPCNVRVTIINRLPGNISEPLMPGRDIVEIDLIEKKIIAYSQRARINVTVSTMYFEGKSFEEQVHIMQKADVLVGVHGAGLSNLIFARKQTPVLEIFPFFYHPIRFEMISRAFNLRYNSISADPDPATYFRCINFRSRNGRKQGTLLMAIDGWREAMRRRNLSYEIPLNSAEDKRTIAIRSCARSQRLWINTATLSSRILSMAKEHCSLSFQ